MDINIILAVLFVLFLIVVVIVHRKKISVQKLVGPVIFVILMRTGFGLKLMDKWGKKYRNLLKLVGQISIGLAFFGMVYISVSIIIVIVKMLFQPETVQGGFALVLPFTNIPGVGYLSFTYWIIAIFVLAVVHEFSHGVMARAYDVPVKSSGFAIFSIIAPIIPAAFVEPDEKRLNKKDDVTQYSVFAAGPISNILLSFVFLFLLSFVFVPIENRITEPLGFSLSPNSPDMPAAQAGVPDNFVVTSYNGERVTDANHFVEQMYYCTDPGDEITLSSSEESFTLIAVDAGDGTGRGIVGVSDFQNERDIKPEYKIWKGAFFWTKGLVRWLFLLNLFIGFANLLPLGIVDGGRMLQVALSRTMKNQKRAMKIWRWTSLFFFGMIVLGLILQYVGNPINLFK